MRVVLAGGSGLIGTALRESLRADGHQILTLVRREPHSADERRWNPGAGQLDESVFDGADAVLCLSGVGVGDHRWTSSYKREIRESRVRSVSTVARSLARQGGVPVLIAASAVGYYGDAGDRIVTESDPPGDTFLARVCIDWEAAAEPARAAGIRVTTLRSGLVLAGDGALMKRLKPVMQLGVGGPLGSGRQYFPWVSIADEVGAIRFLLTQEVAGPVNVTAPAPVTNGEFMATLGRLLHRPAALPTPGLALRAVLGEFADELLIGQRAVPAVLTDAGYDFRHPDLEPALQAALGSR